MVTFRVNTAQDVVANDGRTSLREAINAAANSPGRDTIEFLTFVQLNDSLPILQPGNDIDFVGFNPSAHGVNGGGNHPLFIVNGANVSFSDLILRNGQGRGGDGVRGGGGGLGAGGALFINRGNVVVDNVTFQSNGAFGGSGSNGRGDGNRGGNDSGSGQNGFPGGRGGNFNSLSDGELQVLGFAPGGSGGDGGRGGRSRAGNSREAGFSGDGGGSGGFGSGGGSGGGGGGGAGGAGAAFSGRDGGNGGFGGSGGFGAGAGGGGGGGGGGANVLLGSTGEGGVGRSPGFPGVFGGFGQSGASGTDGRSTAGGNSPGNGGIGGDGGNGAGLGGAIFVNSGANLAVIDSRFNNNFATASGGAAQGRGGAIFVRSGATAAGTGLSFNSNIALSGDRDVSGTLGNLIIPLATIAPRQTPQESRPGSGQFVVNLSNSFPVDLDINYSVGGTATPGQDHDLFGGTIAIPAGQTSAILDLGVLDDTIYDPDETVIVTLNSGRNYRTTFLTRSATTPIADNEPLVAIAPGVTPQEEGEIPGTFDLTLTQPAPAGGLVVDYEVGGTATPGDDYEPLTGNILIPAGATGGTIEVATFDDVFIDPDETVSVTLVERPNREGYGVGADNTATLTIADNEQIPEISLAAADPEIGESGFGRFELTLSEPAPVGGLTVNYAVSGTAANGEDYGELTGTAFVLPGNREAGIGIAGFDDFLAEGEETVELTLEAGENYAIAADNTASMTLTDDDEAGVEVSAIGGNTSEAGGTATFDVVLASEPRAPIVVDLASSDTSEGTVSPASLTFTPDDWDVPQTATVAGVDDDEADGNQSYTVETTVNPNSDDGDYLDLDPDDVSVVNLDDDRPNVLIAQTEGNTAVAEGGNSDTYEVVLTTTPTAMVTVTLTPGGELDLSETALTFTPENALTPQTVTVSAVDDDEIEGPHGDFITHAADSADTDYDAIAIAEIAVQIADDDRPTVTVASGGDGSEQSAIPGIFSLFLSDRAPAGGVEVAYSLDGEAQPVTDYTPLSGTVLIPEGEFGANVFVNPVNDAIDESPETLTLTLEEGADYQIGAENAATLTLTDDDVAGVRVIETGNRTNVAEGGTTDSYLVSLTSEPTADVTISANTDNQLDPISPLTFTPDNWDRFQRVTVSAVDDGIVEDVHSSLITHVAASADSDYEGIEIRDVTANIRDRSFDPRTTAEGLGVAFDRLQEVLERELHAIALPIVGEIDDFAPAFIERFRNTVVNRIVTARDLTQGELERILEESISAVFPNVEVASETTAEETTFSLNLGEEFQIPNVSLSEDLGLPALDLTLAGETDVSFDYDLNLNFGINRDFGFFIEPENTGISADIDVSLGNDFNAAGEFGFLPFDFTDDADNPTAVNLDFNFNLEDLDGNAGGDRLTTDELAGNFPLENLFDATATGDANLGLGGRTNFLGNPAIPGLTFDLGVDWESLNYAGGESTASRAPTVAINRTGLDLGSFASDFARPFFQQLDPIIAPFRPVIEALNTDTEIFYAISERLGEQFDPNDDGVLTVIELAATLAELSGVGSFNTAFFDAVVAIDEVIRLAAQLQEGENIVIDRGSYVLEGFDPTDPDDSIDGAELVANTAVGSPNLDVVSAGTRAFLEAFQGLQGLDLPILTDPATTAELIIGKPDINLLTYDVPELAIDFELQTVFPLLTIGVVSINGLLEGGFGASADLGFGYDTAGLTQWADRDFAASEAFRVLDGFFLSDRENPDGTGEDVPELNLEASIAAGAGLDVVGVGGYLSGGIEGLVGIDINDGGEAVGTDDGKVRFSEDIIPRLGQPWQLFNVEGVVNAFLGAEITVFGRTVYETRIATFELARFTLGNTNSFRGFGIDPYLAGATVFFDADFDGVRGADEPFTVTNADGSFTLDVSLPIFDTDGSGAIDASEGRLVLLGGNDTATFQPQTIPLSAVPEATVITSLTSVISELVGDGAEVETAVARVRQGLGLPADVDLNTFDPLDAIDGGDPVGLDVFARQVQLQNTVVQATRLLRGADPQGDSDEMAVSLMDAIAGRIGSGSVDLADPNQLRAVLEEVAADLGETAGTAATIIAEGNRRIDAIAAGDLSLEERATEITRVQFVAQGDVAADLEALGGGSLSGEDAIAENTGDALDRQISDAEVHNPLGGVADSFGEIINGTPARDTLAGTGRDDIITGMAAADTLTGGDGADVFVYQSVRDAGDVITDFEVGADQIALTTLLESIGYEGENALADGIVVLAEMDAGTMVEIDRDGPDGGGGLQPLLMVENVAIEELENPENFIF